MIVPKFDKDTYQMILQNLSRVDRKLLEDIVEEMGGVDKFNEMVNTASEAYDDLPMVDEEAFERLVESGALFTMSDEEFEYFIGNDPAVTKAQEEMAWVETDALLSKFFKKA